MLVVFRLDEQRYGLALACVERIVHAVALTPLPRAPGIVSGIIDVGGRVLPVFNLRRRFRLPERDLLLGDQLVLANTAGRTVVLPVDSVEGVVPFPVHSLVRPSRIVPGLTHLLGVAQLDDALVLIQDLDQFLSLEEARTLDAALNDPRGDS